MILDSQTQLSASQAVTVSAVATNVYDTTTAGNDISVGEEMVAVISVIVAAKVSSLDETYQFDFNNSASADLSSPTLLARRVFTNAMATAVLTLGALIVVPIPQGSKTLRYIGLNYVTGGSSPSITCSVEIQPARMLQFNKVYAKGYTVI